MSTVSPVRGSMVVTLAMTRGAIAVVAAVLGAGCSGGDERKQAFAAADAARIASVRPARPGWSWPENPKKHVSSGGSTTKALSNDPLDVELGPKRRAQRPGYRGGRACRRPRTWPSQLRWRRGPPSASLARRREGRWTGLWSSSLPTTRVSSDSPASSSQVLRVGHSRSARRQRPRMPASARRLHYSRHRGPPRQRRLRRESWRASRPSILAQARPLTYSDIRIYWSRGPLFRDVGCLQCSCRGAPSGNPGRADRRREGRRDDRGRPFDVPAPGLEAPTRAQR